MRRVLACHHSVDFNEYVKRAFWSFVAGFSEHFVTDIISRFQGKAAKHVAANDGGGNKPPAG